MTWWYVSAAGIAIGGLLGFRWLYNRNLRCRCGRFADAVRGGTPLCWHCANSLARRAAIAARCPCGNHADAMVSHHPVCRRCVQALDSVVASLHFRGLTDREIIRYLVEAGRDAEAEILLKKLENTEAAYEASFGDREPN